MYKDVISDNKNISWRQDYIEVNMLYFETDLILIQI